MCLCLRVCARVRVRVGAYVSLVWCNTNHREFTCSGPRRKKKAPEGNKKRHFSIEHPIRIVEDCDVQCAGRPCSATLRLHFNVPALPGRGLRLRKEKTPLTFAFWRANRAHHSSPFGCPLKCAHRVGMRCSVIGSGFFGDRPDFEWRFFFSFGGCAFVCL